jgi:hypothetical protein
MIIMQETNIISIDLVSVLKVRSRLGNGLLVDDPVRLITEYYTMDGELIVRIDDWKRSIQGTINDLHLDQLKDCEIKYEIRKD